jgi:hypothetical protein
MSGAALRTVAKAATERLIGDGPGPVRAAVAAIITGGATAAITYRVLRSDSLGDGDKK